MPKKSNKVAKVFVRVKMREDTYCLFSRKNAPGRQKHSHLELIGGNIEDEDFLEGAMRELKEEEMTGFLAGNLSKKQLKSKVKIGTTDHYIFEILLTYDEYLKLKHDPDESLGFELKAESELHKDKFQSEFTKKTKKIFKALGIGL